VSIGRGVHPRPRLPDQPFASSVAAAATPGAQITIRNVGMNPTRTGVIDASTAHRVAPGWTYGLPELRPGQRDAISASKRVAVTGCHAAGFILALAPLVAAGRS
jgi:N-acetyl-gamma-glutamyl-phosphate reductase